MQPFKAPIVSNIEKIEEGIDAIELRYFGDWEKASPSGKLFWKLYGWDCDCILILNPYCIEKEW